MVCPIWLLYNDNGIQNSIFLGMDENIPANIDAPINDPRRKRRGISEERQLAVLVELMVGPALLLDVVTDRPLVAVSTDGAREIAVRPELSTPQLPLDLRAPSEDLPCGQALDDRHQPRHAIGWDRLHQEVHVILVRPDL